MVETNALSSILQGLENGDEAAANRIWQECYPRLVHYARRKLEGVAQGMSGPEDVALSALKSFFKAAQLGRFPNLADRDDLWRILLSMTARKSIDLRRYEDRRRVHHTAVPDVPGTLSEEEIAVRISEELEHNLALLEDDLLEYAVAKLEGYTNAEIARRFGKAHRTVERKLRLIRRTWREDNTSRG